MLDILPTGEIQGVPTHKTRNWEMSVLHIATAAIMRLWAEGWAVMFAALEPLRAGDMSRTVLIRHQPHTVVQAINRQLTHYAYHIGQIVFLAKHIGQDKFQSLTVPRGKSEEVNAKMAEKWKK